MNIFCDSSTREACYVFEEQEPVVVPYPERVTVNTGQYLAAILALEEALKQGLEDIVIWTDSLLVANQVNGIWECRKKHLLPFRDKVKGLAQEVQAAIRWIPRDENIAGKVIE